MLHHWPAALAGASALRWLGIGIGAARQSAVRTAEPIEIAISRDRAVEPARGTTVTRIADFDSAAHHHLNPPRLRIERAVLQVAAAAEREDAAVATLADACQSRRTTPERLRATLVGLTRIRHRRLLLTILDDVASGAYSALERRYLVRVERRHGLPTGRRQRRVSAGRTVGFRDVDYLGLRTIVELDGRLGHEVTSDRWQDLDRDVLAAVRGSLTVRLGWKQVLEPCRLAAALARILTSRGWTGRALPCGPGCPVGWDGQ